MRFLFAVSLVFFSCKGQFNYIIKSSRADGNYSIYIDSVDIKTDSRFNSQYYTYSTFDDEKFDYLVAFNSLIPSIDVFNITNRTALTQLALDKTILSDGVDKHDLDKSKTITDIQVINFDSIIINYSNRRLFILDSNLRKLKDIALDSIGFRNNLYGQPISYSNNVRMFLFKDKLVLSYIYPQLDWEKKYPVFSVLDLKKEKLEFLPIAFSEYLYSIGGQAGFLTSPVTSEYQQRNFLTFNYAYESNIYQYNPTDSTIAGYGGSMVGSKNHADAIVDIENDEAKLLDNWRTHHVESPVFFNIMYDRYRKIYYRFSLKEIPRKNGKYFNSVLDKPLVLMVFNEKFKVLCEVELPRHIYASNSWFITKEGLFIAPLNNKYLSADSGILRYHIIKIVKND